MAYCELAVSVAIMSRSRKTSTTKGEDAGSGSGSSSVTAHTMALPSAVDKTVNVETATSSGKEDKKEPMSPLRTELKKEIPPSPAKYAGAVSSKKRLFDGERKTPVAKKPPGTAKVSAALVTAKVIVTSKEANHTSAGHRVRVSAMPTVFLSEVCGFPTTPRDCRGKVVCSNSGVECTQLRALTCRNLSKLRTTSSSARKVMFTKTFVLSSTLQLKLWI
jgi:hypothetical protein